MTASPIQELRNNFEIDTQQIRKSLMKLCNNLSSNFVHYESENV